MNLKGENPWEVLPKVWKTESSYMSFFRGQLRRAWSRHPMRIELMKSRRLEVPEEERERLGNRIKHCYECESCGKLYAAKNIEVDHITPAGSLKTKEDLGSFASRLLFVMPEDLQLLCKGLCHPVKSYMDARNVSEEEASLSLSASKFMKQSAKKQKEILSVTGKPLNNPKERKEAYYYCINKGILTNPFTGTNFTNK
jgi:hypothetical protein